MSNISFIIPFRTDNGYRQKIFDWHTERIRGLFPQAEIVVGDSDPGAPFNRSAARNNGYKQSTGDILFFNDADIIFDPLSLVKAIEVVKQNPGLGWVLPFDTCHSLDEESGKRVLSCTTSIVLENLSLTDIYTFTDPPQDPNLAPTYSGLVCMDRVSFEVIGGYDESFQGWGFEDWAFKDAANLYVGQYKRVPGNIYHIWHPREGEEDNPLLPINQQRWEYLKATNDYRNWL